MAESEKGGSGDMINYVTTIAAANLQEARADTLQYVT